jgi:hypothetical protein
MAATQIKYTNVWKCSHFTNLCMFHKSNTFHPSKNDSHMKRKAEEDIHPQAKKMKIDSIQIPHDTVPNILSFVDSSQGAQCILNCMLTCKDWNEQVSLSDIVWKRACESVLKRKDLYPWFRTCGLFEEKSINDYSHAYNQRKDWRIVYRDLYVYFVN